MFFDVLIWRFSDQLEDFEKEASFLIQQSKLHIREVLVQRYRHFVEAIKEQIRRIEKNMDYPSLRDSIADTSRINFNAQNEDSLESFLSGVTVNHVDHARHKGKVTEDRSFLKGFLDVSGASCSVGNTDEINKEDTEESGTSVTKRDTNCIYDGPEINQSIIAENDDWDLEACTSRSEVLQRKKLEELIVRISIFFNFIRSYLSLYGNRISRNYNSKLKDEEHLHSPSFNILQRTKVSDVSSYCFVLFYF